MTSPVSHGLSQIAPTPTGQKLLTHVAKLLQQAANFTTKSIHKSDSIENETVELITRLSSKPDNFKLYPTNPITSIKQLKRNPNRKVE